MAIESHLTSLRKSWEDTDFTFWLAMRWMHLHNRLCFHSGYDTISWLGGFACLVRVYEEAESCSIPRHSGSQGRSSLPLGLILLNCRLNLLICQESARALTKQPSLSLCSKPADLIFLGNLIFSWMPKLMLRHHGKGSHKALKRLVCITEGSSV